MENRIIRFIGLLLCLPIIGFVGAAFLRILTFQAVAPVVVALLAVYQGLIGVDYLLNRRRIMSILPLISAVMTLILAFILFSTGV